jgi:hypothetical protein
MESPKTLANTLPSTCLAVVIRVLDIISTQPHKAVTACISRKAEEPMNMEGELAVYLINLQPLVLTTLIRTREVASYWHPPTKISRSYPSQTFIKACTHSSKNYNKLIKLPRVQD